MWQLAHHSTKASDNPRISRTGIYLLQLQLAMLGFIPSRLRSPLRLRRRPHSGCPRPPGFEALLLARGVTCLLFSDSTYEEFYGLGRTREPLYFGPRLPKMAKVAKIGYKTVVG